MYCIYFVDYSDDGVGIVVVCVVCINIVVVDGLGDYFWVDDVDVVDVGVYIGIVLCFVDFIVVVIIVGSNICLDLFVLFVMFDCYNVYLNLFLLEFR